MAEYGQVTSIVERPVGTTLAGTAGPGDSVLSVDDISRFTWPAGGLRIGSEQFAYTIDAAADQSVDTIDIDEDDAGSDEAGTITLAGTLTGSYGIDEPVVQFQTSVVTERMATVLLADQAEELLLRVPRGLWDRLPSNIRERDLAPETVALADVGGSWVMTDVVDEDPNVDGSFINPATLPANTGGIDPGTAADIGTFFTEAWSNPTRGTAADGSFATATGTSSSATVTAHNTGFAFPGNASNNSAVGSLAWNNPAQIKAKQSSGGPPGIADLATSAYVGSGSGTSQYLEATNFGFAVPPGATITSITVELTRAANTSITVFDNLIKLMKAGALAGSDASSAAAWPTNWTTSTYGGDLWGTTWTPAQVNASNFGVTIQVLNAATAIAFIDAIRVRVNYTTTSVTSFRSNTHFLAASDFSFAVPDDSTIIGITAAIKRKSSDNLGDDYAIDNQVRLVTADLEASTDRGQASHWPTAAAYATYGGDLWGLELTSDDVNDSDFAVWISVNTNFNVTASIDHIKATVYYVAAGDF